MTVFRILLVLLVIPFAASAADFELPNPPAGQILDQDDWLGRDDKKHLEGELTRFRDAHGVDVLVVIWSQAFGSEGDLQDLARRLGETWSRESLWAVVVQHQESPDRPFTAWGGELLEKFTAGSLDESLREAVSRGLKEWSDRNRVSGVALNLGEELVFHRNRHQAEREALQFQQLATETAAKQQGRTQVIRYSLLGLAILIAAALLVIGWIRYRSRPTKFQFPQTRWRRRLGASWSGGSNLNTSFTSSDDD